MVGQVSIISRVIVSRMLLHETHSVHVLTKPEEYVWLLNCINYPVKFTLNQLVTLPTGDVTGAGVVMSVDVLLR